MFGCRGSIGLVDDDIGCGEACLNVPFADLDVFQEISVGAFLMDLRRTGFECVDGIADDGQLFEVNFDQVQRSCGYVLAVSGDDRDGVANVADFPAAEHGPIDADDAMGITARHVLVRQHRVYPVEPERCGCVDRTDSGVRNVGALRTRVQHSGEAVVVSKPGGPPDLRQRVGVRAWPADFCGRGPCLWQVRRHVLAGRLQNRINHALVAGTSAVRVFERGADVGLCHLPILDRNAIQQAFRGHDQSGRADAALHGAVIQERLLQWMQAVVAGQALNGLHARTLGLERRINAADNRGAVDEHGTNAALSLGTADLRASQPQVIPEHVRQVTRLFDLDVDGCSVHRHLKAAHCFAPARRAAVARIIGR